MSTLTEKYSDLGFVEEEFDTRASDEEPLSAFDRFIYENSLSVEEFKSWRDKNGHANGVVLGIGEEHMGSVIAFASKHDLQPFYQLGGGAGWSLQSYIDVPLKKGGIIVFLLPPEKLFSHSSRGFTWMEANYILTNSSADNWEKFFL